MACVQRVSDAGPALHVQVEGGFACALDLVKYIRQQVGAWGRPGGGLMWQPGLGLCSRVGSAKPSTGAAFCGQVGQAGVGQLDCAASCLPDAC